MSVPVLVISGTIGAGKSAVLYQCTDILEALGEPYAAVELDALSAMSPRPPDDPHYASLAFANLAAVWENMAARGARRLLVGAAVESVADRERYAAAVPEAEVTVVLLTASRRVIEERLRGREIGSALGWHLERSSALEAVLEQAGAHDHFVRNEGPIESVAREVLRRGGWPAG